MQVLEFCGENHRTINSKQFLKEKVASFYRKQPFFRASCRIRTNDPEITNHVLWPTELKRQVGKLTISRRYNQLPLLRSSPGGFEGSWPYGTYPYFKKLAIPELSARYFLIAGAKVGIFSEYAIRLLKKMQKKMKRRHFSCFYYAE